MSTRTLTFSPRRQRLGGHLGHGTFVDHHPTLPYEILANIRQTLLRFLLDKVTFPP